MTDVLKKRRKDIQGRMAIMTGGRGRNHDKAAISQRNQGLFENTRN